MRRTKPLPPQNNPIRSHSSASDLNRLTAPAIPRQAFSQTASYNGDADETDLIFSVAAVPPGGNPTIVEGPGFQMTTNASLTGVVKSPRTAAIQPMTDSPPRLEGRVYEVTDESNQPSRSLFSSPHSPHSPNSSNSRPHSPQPQRPTLIRSFLSPDSPVLLSQAAPPPYPTAPSEFDELEALINLSSEERRPSAPSPVSSPDIQENENSVDIRSRGVSVRVEGPAQVNGHNVAPSSVSSTSSDDSNSPPPSYFRMHWEDFVKQLTLWNILWVTFKVTVSTIASSSTSLNAGVNATDSQPKDIGEEWWSKLSDFIVFMFFLESVSSFLVNYPFSYESIPSAGKKLRKNLLKYPQTPREVFENALTVTLGTSAAIATGAIAYNSFTWTKKFTGNESIADIVSMASLLINFTTRYVGVRKLINRLRGFNDQELILKKQLSNDLTHIHPGHLEQIKILLNKAYSENDNTLNETTIKLFIDKIIETNDPEFIDAFAGLTTAQYYSLYSLEVLFSIIIGLAALPVFTQLGYNGFNILVTKCGSDKLEHLDRFYKGAIGIMPGVATAMLYAVCALDIPSVVINIFKELYQTRRVWDLFVFVVFTAALGLSSGSMQNVTEGILKNEDRIFDFFEMDNIQGLILIALIRIGAGTTNAISVFSVLFGQPAKRDPEIRDVRKWLYNEVHIDQRLDKLTFDSLKKYSVFRTPTPAITNGYVALAGDDDDLENGHPQPQPNGNRPG
jgi:hypothetical protein